MLRARRRGRSVTGWERVETRDERKVKANWRDGEEEVEGSCTPELELVGLKEINCRSANRSKWSLDAPRVA